MAFLFIIGSFFGSDISHGQIHMNVVQVASRHGKKNYILSNDTFTAPE